MRALSIAASAGLLDAVKELKLNSNHITDCGLYWFTCAVSQSLVMPKLNELHLGGNALNPRGLQALASAVCKGALPTLRELWLYKSDPGAAEMRGHLPSTVSCRWGAMRG